MKKIYFAGAINGSKEKHSDYIELINYLKKYFIILTENIWTEALPDDAGEFIYKRHTNWMKESDIIVADISLPSIGVGYEIAYAESINKRIILLYDINSTQKLSFLATGKRTNQVLKYNSIKELKDKLSGALK